MVADHQQKVPKRLAQDGLMAWAPLDRRAGQDLRRGGVIKDVIYVFFN